MRNWFSWLLYSMHSAYTRQTAAWLQTTDRDARQVLTSVQRFEAARGDGKGTIIISYNYSYVQNCQWHAMKLIKWGVTYYISIAFFSDFDWTVHTIRGQQPWRSSWAPSARRSAASWSWSRSPSITGCSSSSTKSPRVYFSSAASCVLSSKLKPVLYTCTTYYVTLV